MRSSPCEVVQQWHSYTVGKVVKIGAEDRYNNARVSIEPSTTSGYGRGGALRSVYACNVVVLNPGALDDPSKKEVSDPLL